MGVVDVARIFSQSEAAKSIETQRNTLREAFLSEISVFEQGLRKQEQELAKTGSSLSHEDYAKKRLAYEEQIISTRKMAQEKKQLLEEAASEAMDKLRDELTLVVQEIAHERGYSLVISNRDVIAGEQSLDITEETIKRLNEKIKEIELSIKEKKNDG